MLNRIIQKSYLSLSVLAPKLYTLSFGFSTFPCIAKESGGTMPYRSKENQSYAFCLADVKGMRSGFRRAH